MLFINFADKQYYANKVGIICQILSQNRRNTIAFYPLIRIVLLLKFSNLRFFLLLAYNNRASFKILSSKNRKEHTFVANNIILREHAFIELFVYLINNE